MSLWSRGPVPVAHVKRSLANLARVAHGRFQALVRNRLKGLEYRPDVLDSFLTGTKGDPRRCPAS